MQKERASLVPLSNKLFNNNNNLKTIILFNFIAQISHFLIIIPLKFPVFLFPFSSQASSFLFPWKFLS